MKRFIRMIFVVAVFSVLLMHTHEVRAICEVGDTIAPPKVTTLKASVVSINGTLRLVLEYTVPTDPSILGGEIDIRYRIGSPLTALNWAATTVTTQITGEPAPDASGTLQVISLSGLLPNTTYYFALKLKDACGKWSAMSNVVSFTTPDAPQAVAELNFTWTANPEPIAGYKVCYGYGSRDYAVCVDIGNVTTAAIIVTEPGVSYYFACKAYYGPDESLYSNEVVYTMPSS